MGIKRVKSKRFDSGWGWRVEIDRKGVRIRQTFETRKVAEDVHDAILGDHVRRRYNLHVESRVTLDELIEHHLEVMKKRGRDKTNWKRAETVLFRFRDLVGADRLVETVKTSDLNSYVESRFDLNPKLKPQTINREMNEIKGCLSAASRYYRALEEWRSPRAPWLEEPSDGRRQTYGDDHIASILRMLYAPKRPREKDEHVQGRHAVGDMFRVALQTGMRAGEVRRLRKTDVDFSRRVIVVTSKKGMSVRRNALTREVPMSGEVFEILSRRAREAAGSYLFSGRDPERPLADHRKAFITACVRAGVPYGLNGVGSLIFNDARRTAENTMLEAGHQPRAVGDILGHSPETMAKHYARSTPRSRRDAVEVLKNFGGILVEETAETAQSAQSANKKRAKKAGTKE